MLRRTTLIATGVHTRYPIQETTYPYPEPFKHTPYEKKFHNPQPKTWPRWMDDGFDGTGKGIGLYRTHPLSKLKGNYSRKRDHIPQVIRLMTQGKFHASGRRYIRKSGRVPDPTRFPVLTGKPAALGGWSHEEPELLRTFEVPVMDESRQGVYKPYVALHEKAIVVSSSLEEEGNSKGSEVEVAEESPKESKSLRKRLFFWR